MESPSARDIFQALADLDKSLRETADRLDRSRALIRESDLLLARLRQLNYLRQAGGHGLGDLSQLR